jgi:hypothetical protein
MGTDEVLIKYIDKKAEPHMPVCHLLSLMTFCKYFMLLRSSRFNSDLPSQAELISVRNLARTCGYLTSVKLRIAISENLMNREPDSNRTKSMP